MNKLLKTNKSLLTFVLIFSMLLSIVPLARADFVSIQQITPRTGTSGTASPTLGGTIAATNVKVDGSAEPGDIVLLSLDDGSVQLSCVPVSCKAQADATGAYTVSFTVPFVPGGSHIVKATNTNQTALNPVTDTFTVTPVVELEQAGRGPSFLTGVVGRTVTIEGSGFAANSPITLAYDGNGLTCTPAPGCGLTATTGTFRVQFLVPPSVTGTHVITATDGSGLSSSTKFSVVRDIHATVTSASPALPHSIAANCPAGQACVVVGSTVKVGATGFPGGTDITVFFSTSTTVSSTDRVVCQGTTDGRGSFSCPTVDTIPATAQSGSTPATVFHYIANDTTSCGNCPSTAVNLFPLLVLTPDGAAFNQQVNGQGTGFAPNSSLSVTISCSASIHSGGTDSSGSFTFNFVIQSGQCIPGIYTITAKDGSGFSDTARFVLGTHIITTPDHGIATDGATISGTDVTIDGFVFSQNSNVVITFDGQQVGSIKADSNGGFEVHITVPEALGGTANARITATDNGNRCSGNTACSASAAFMVLPWITTSANTGAVGTSVTVEGSGFGNINDPAGTISSHSVSVLYCGANASSSTLVHVSFLPDKIPLDQAQACNTISVIPLSGPPAPNRLGTSTQWTVYTIGSDVSVATGTFTNLGSFKTSFSSPESWGGYHTVSANEINSNNQVVRSGTNGALFRITPTVSITPSKAPSGQLVTLSGTGFFQWEKYTTQTGDQPAQTFTESAGIVIDFGASARYVDQAHFILNGQVDTAWFQDLYRPVALNSRGTIIYWDSLFNRLGGVNGESQFLRVPSSDAMNADGTTLLTITGYRFEMSNPEYDTREATTSSFTLSNPAVSHTNDAMNTIDNNIQNVGTQVTNGVASINGNINGAVTTINGNVNDAMNSINGNVNGAVTTINGKVSDATSSINTHVDGQISSAMSSINTHTDSQVSSALSSVNSHTDSQVASLSSNVSSLPQTPITYVIATLAAIAAVAAVASTLVVSRRLKVAG
jgi:hypothetical protein